MSAHALEDGRHVTHQAVRPRRITVADLDAVTAFFAVLGLEVEGRTFVEGELIDTVIVIPDSLTERIG